MCTPTIAIGALIGGGIGYAAGGKKGALLGAVGGGFGGYALGGLGGAGAVGLGASGIPYAAPWAVLPGGGIGGGLITVGGATGAGAAGGAGFLSQAFGGGGLGNFLLSPGFSLGTQLIGFGVQMVGVQQQAAFQRAQIAFRQSLLRTQQIAAAQDNKALLERLAVQKGIIGDQGKQARGQFRVDAAGRNVLVDVGSEADKTQQLAAQVVFQKLLFEQETDLKIRDNNIRAAGFQTDRALLDFQLAESQRAGTFGLVGGALKQVSGLTSQFRWDRSGQLKFRTRSA